MIATTRAETIIMILEALFSGAISSISVLDILVESAEEMPVETKVLTMLITRAIGMKMLTAASASFPTRLPITKPSTIDSSIVARLVATMKGR